MKYLTVKEVADILRLNLFTVYRHIEGKKIPSVKIGKRVLVDEEELKEFMQRSR